MDQPRPTVSEKAATIVVVVLAGLAVLSFAVAGIAVFENLAPATTAARHVPGSIG